MEEQAKASVRARRTVRISVKDIRAEEERQAAEKAKAEQPGKDK